MNNVSTWLNGNKTYIIAVASIVYGVLAYEKVLPNPEHLSLLVIEVGALAIGFRSALAKLMEVVASKP